MAEYSSILLENAVEALSKLPGIGKKTALRLALHLLNEDTLETEQLADSLLMITPLRILLLRSPKSIITKSRDM